ncbi:MAG: hypothetical protein IH977_11815 [Nitrospinae bacterium]|nr:hypothetical protein [Nitrospinota bacterium]
MEITVFKEPVDGSLNLVVSLYEFTDNKGKNVDVSIWVPAQDSMAELERAARKAAIVQLKRALSTLESEDPHDQQGATP